MKNSCTFSFAKKVYLDIVHSLADKEGIQDDLQKLDTAAEKFALKRGTRSAHAAKQFVAGNVTNIV